jgi:hypothetical protein
MVDSFIQIINLFFQKLCFAHHYTTFFNGETSIKFDFFDIEFRTYWNFNNLNFPKSMWMDIHTCNEIFNIVFGGMVSTSIIQLIRKYIKQ